jgi:hypothetical protein
MQSIIIGHRFCGPPNSGNGGYVCGLLAAHIDGGAEITLRAPPPLEQQLDVIASNDGALELHEADKVIATGRPVQLDVSDVPAATFSEAEDAARRTPYDESNHNLPTCFVCGPARAHGDGLRIFPGPLRPEANTSTVAASWVPYADLVGEGGRVAPEFVWAALDCPTAYAGLSARHLGLSGAETILLGRMAARIEERPRPGEQCIIVAWPTGRDGRKLFANSALLTHDGRLLAAAKATWLLVDRQTQLGGS